LNNKNNQIAQSDDLILAQLILTWFIYINSLPIVYKKKLLSDFYKIIECIDELKNWLDYLSNWEKNFKVKNLNYKLSIVIKYCEFLT